MVLLIGRLGTSIFGYICLAFLYLFRIDNTAAAVAPFLKHKVAEKSRTLLTGVTRRRQYLPFQESIPPNSQRKILCSSSTSL